MDRLLIRPASGRQAGTGPFARTDHRKDTRIRGHSEIESQTKSTDTTLTTAPDGHPEDAHRCPRSVVGLLERTRAAVRAGGALAVEDADFDGLFCDPPNERFAFYAPTDPLVLKRRGGDHAIGRKLYRYFLDADIPAPNLRLAQGIDTSGSTKTLALSTLEATAEAILADGLASEDELRSALSSLEAFAADPTTVIGIPAHSNTGAVGRRESRSVRRLESHQPSRALGRRPPPARASPPSTPGIRGIAGLHGLSPREHGGNISPTTVVRARVMSPR